MRSVSFYVRATILQEWKSKSYHGEVDPKGNRPRLSGDDKSSEEWSEVGRKNDEGSPDVDLACSFVEEEHVKDEHETSTLGDSAEEAVENASCHEGVKRRCCCAPCCCGRGNDKEVEQDWKAAGPSRESDNKEASSSEHKDVAHLGVIDSVWAHAPDPTAKVSI